MTHWRGIAAVLVVVMGLIVGGNFLDAKQAEATPTMLLGFNDVYTPVGIPTALALTHGSVYSDYANPFSGSEGTSRIRRVRYVKADRHGPSNSCGSTVAYANGLCESAITSYVSGVTGRTWILGNEINLTDQDGSVASGDDADYFTNWYHGIRAAILAGDSTAKIASPSVWNWDGAGSTCCQKGKDAIEAIKLHWTNNYGGNIPWDYMTLDVYPKSSTSWSDPANEGYNKAVLQVSSANDWMTSHSMSKPLLVAEWGLQRGTGPFTSPACGSIPSDGSRTNYTSGVLGYMNSHNVYAALYFASGYPYCGTNGGTYWLIDDSSGTLTIEGAAVKQFYEAN